MLRASRKKDHIVMVILTFSKRVLVPINLYLFIIMMNIMMWNCYGIANDATIRAINNLVFAHDLCILVLLETRISGDRVINQCAKFGFFGCYKVDVDGFKGGLWLL